MIIGNLPNPFPFLRFLETLDMNSNQLSGSVPDLIHRSLLRLKTLNFANQASNVTVGLNGTIPEFLSRLLSLEYVYLNDNSITGLIPLRIATLPKLKVLSLSNNELTGSIPKELANFQAIDEILLSGNPEL